MARHTMRVQDGRVVISVFDVLNLGTCSDRYYVGLDTWATICRLAKLLFVANTHRVATSDAREVGAGA
jgi:hypothetical protein